MPSPRVGRKEWWWCPSGENDDWDDEEDWDEEDGDEKDDWDEEEEEGEDPLWWW